jgi:hypothetical protein
VIVLASAVLGHGRHEFGWHILHAFADHIGNMTERLRVWLRLFSELLNPLLQRKTFRLSFSLSTPPPVHPKARSLSYGITHIFILSAPVF